MTRKPVIGITTSRHKSFIAWACDWLAVWRAGGRPVRLMPGHERPAEKLDGLVIGGGDDIGAEMWGGEVTMDVRIDPDRDALERRLLGEALDRDIPVLGICRGSQMLNIHCGGTLYADIYTSFEDVKRMRTVLPRKTVMIEDGSRLREILRQSVCRVNSLHHQAVNAPGKGFSIAARDSDGIIQAIENPNKRFLVGVQWHPEFLVFDRNQQNLFRALVQAAHDRLHDRAAP